MRHNCVSGGWLLEEVAQSPAAADGDDSRWWLKIRDCYGSSLPLFFTDPSLCADIGVDETEQSFTSSQVWGMGVSVQGCTHLWANEEEQWQPLVRRVYGNCYLWPPIIIIVLVWMMSSCVLPAPVRVSPLCAWAKYLPRQKLFYMRSTIKGTRLKINSY